MKIAVLGSHGQLGTVLVDYLLSKRYSVYTVSRKTIDLTNVEEVRKWLALKTPDVVINCATAGGKLAMNDIIYDDVRNNINVFLSFYNNSDLIKRFINVGSGAEFDIRTDINLAKEEDILSRHPTESYGFSKNVIARMILEKQNFYTLRLFGCFDKKEPDFRLFKKFLEGELELTDRQFDYISSTDFCKIVDHYLVTDILPKDINCVYPDKLYLSQILDKFNRGPVKIIGKNPLSYTGSGGKLASLNIPLDGLDCGIKEYVGI